MDLEIYQRLCAESKILWTQHCLQRMQERGKDVYKRQLCM